jgi:DNA-directed RNA polymerase subunit delta
VGKKKIIKNYEQLPEDIIEQVKEKYPDGFEDNLITFENSRGEIELALPFETEDTYYLIKMPKSNTAEEEEEEDYDNTAIDEFDNFENLEITDDVADEEE